MIQVEHISYFYGNRQVLRDISFSAGPGDCVGILGNNGAGKSTLITCLGRIRAPRSGLVRIDGRNVFAMGRLEAVVAQLERGDCGLDESLKLFEEGAKLAGACEKLLDQAEQKVELLLADGSEVPFEGEE